MPKRLRHSDLGEVASPTCFEWQSDLGSKAEGRGVLTCLCVVFGGVLQGFGGVLTYFHMVKRAGGSKTDTSIFVWVTCLL